MGTVKHVRKDKQISYASNPLPDLYELLYKLQFWVFNYEK